MSEISQWFQSLPQFTRYWFGLSVVFPIAGRIGLLQPYYMILNADFIYKFQLWRPITALFYYPLSPATGFHYLINLYFLYSYSIRLETGEFNGRPAEYLFLLLLNWISMIGIGCFFNLMLLMDPMVLSVLYIWCQLNKETIVTFWFGTQFKAMYLPWVLLGFNMILSGGGYYELIGILVGHFYYFMMIQYPQDYNSAPLLPVPSILYDYFPSYAARGGIHSAPPQRAPQPRAQRRGHDWGSGNMLGRN